MSDAQAARWEQIKSEFRRQKTMGSAEDEPPRNSSSASLEATAEDFEFCDGLRLVDHGAVLELTR